MNTDADRYRRRAAELRAEAQAATSPVLVIELERTARDYIRLAEQAERNATLDLAVEFGPPIRAGG